MRIAYENRLRPRIPQSEQGGGHPEREQTEFKIHRKYGLNEAIVEKSPCI